jgi:phosphoribosylamine--glycine ligase
LHEIVARIARGEGLPMQSGWQSQSAAVTTVVAAPGYPDKPETGHVVRLPRVEDVGVLIFHAGTRRDESGQLVTTGGRVVAITAVGSSYAEAQRLSRGYADRVDLPGKQYRGDIGWRELSRGARAS